MKLLFDENLSPRLVDLLRDIYPGSTHVGLAGRRGATDAEVWELAARNDLVIVSKDNDFRQMSFLRGAPPWVVWLAIGNAGTSAIERLLRRRTGAIEAFASDPEASLLILELTETEER